MNEFAIVLSPTHRTAILDAEARRLARTLAGYGVLTERRLLELSGARRWRRGVFSLALARAIETGLVRDLGCGFYAAPLHTFSAKRGGPRRPRESSTK